MCSRSTLKGSPHLLGSIASERLCARLTKDEPTKVREEESEIEGEGQGEGAGDEAGDGEAGDGEAGDEAGECRPEKKLQDLGI